MRALAKLVCRVSLVVGLAALCLAGALAVAITITGQLVTIDRKSTRLNSSHYLRQILPIYAGAGQAGVPREPGRGPSGAVPGRGAGGRHNHHRPTGDDRSEEHTSELQSLPTADSSDLCGRWPSWCAA